MRSAGLVRAGVGTSLPLLLVLALAGPAAADAAPPAGADAPVPASTSTSTPTPSLPPSPSSTPEPTSPPPAAPTTPATPTTSPPASHAPVPASGSTGDREPDSSATLSAAQIAEQIAAANDIWAALTAANSQLAGALKQMDALSAKANTLLESISNARDAQQAAQTAAATARSQLTVVQVQLENARAVTRLWAFESYTEGGRAGELAGVLDAMGSDPAHAATSAGDLAYLTDARLRSLEDIAGLESDQARLTAEADKASQAAAFATATLERSKAQLDPLLEQQRAAVDGLRTAQMAEIAKAGPVADLLIGVQTPQARAAADRLRAALAAVASTAFTGGKPCSNDQADYPNGILPPSALCPLWQAPGESLRPKAAAAFNAMSEAYATQMGTPLCVTDSYRTLAEQYAVKASRGVWAATPGTSKHGLGLAVDLCGGVENFGSPQHLWMQLNAPLYGWFHPSWAEPGGTLPEPWHWEYAG